MIKFSLTCDHGHEFEGWFGDNDDFARQNKRGFITCPVCSSDKIEKSLMAPAVSTARKRDEKVRLASVRAHQAHMADQLKQLRKHVEANAENVGEKFPEEARKIHYGEVEARGIYGKASMHEAAELIEEGVGVVPLPDLPEDKN